MAILWIPSLSWTELFVCAAFSAWFLVERAEALWTIVRRRLQRWL